MATLSITPDGTEPGPLPEPDLSVEPGAPIGQLGDAYTLLREIASGGMGRVYLARETGADGFSRNVALKRIHDHLSNRRAFVTMFLDEARIASRIQHPNVCAVFDFGRVDGAYYIAMEYLRGVALSEVLRALGTRAPEDRPERLWLGAHLLVQACEGLHAAHELRDDEGALLNVVHRDVSPHNLFVGFDGSLRVLDFGVARAADRLSESTTGRVKGKFAYMAPEQALGKHVSRRADLFSLGVVLWELLTLQRLYRKDNPGETVLAVVRDAPEHPGAYARDVPPELADIAMKALSRDPEERFATAREMGRALAKAIAKSGHAPMAADVADWMDQIFPGQREASYRLLQSADEAMQSAGPGAEASMVRARRGSSQEELTKRGPRRGVWIALGVAAMLAMAGLGAALALLAVSPADATPAVRLPDHEPAGPTATPSSSSETPAPAASPQGSGETPAELEAAADDDVAPAPTQRARRRATPRRARRRAAPTRTGRVRFSGPSELWGARVMANGRAVGTVPGTVDLPVGRQVVVIVAPGRGRMRRVVQVSGSGETRVVLR